MAAPQLFGDLYIYDKTGNNIQYSYPHYEFKENVTLLACLMTGGVFVKEVSNSVGGTPIDIDTTMDQVYNDYYDSQSDSVKLYCIQHVIHRFMRNGKEYVFPGNVSSVNTKTGDVVLDADDISDTATTHKFVTASDLTILSNTSGTNTGDQTASDFDIKDLADSTSLRTTWSAKQDAFFTSSGTTPSTPSEGDMWYDTANDVLKVYDGSTWNSVGGGGGGSGDVVGPASSTDGNVALFDGITGKLIKDGGPLPTGFNPSNAGSTDQVLTKTAGGYEWANAAGSDYSWVTKTISGGEIEIGLRTIVNVPTSNFTLTLPATLKDGEEYAIRIISETSYTMTLGTGFTNPRNVDTTLSGNATDQYVFLAIGGELELQPLVDTGA